MSLPRQKSRTSVSIHHFLQDKGSWGKQDARRMLVVVAPIRKGRPLSLKVVQLSFIVIKQRSAAKRIECVS